MSPRRAPAGMREEHRLSAEGSTYSVWAASAKVKRAFDAYYDELELGTLVARLGHDPHRRVPGKTKKLRGRLAGILQYDLPDGNRAHYRIEEHDVILVYVGRHPKAGG